MRRRAAICGLAGAFVLVLAPAAVAREYVVNTTQDLLPGTCDDGTCTLREAVQLANPAPTDTIRVPAGEYILTRGELVLIGDRITGDGARSTIINANGSSRVIRVSSNTAPASSTVTGVTIRGGNGTTGPNGPNGNGGGVYIESGSLALSNSHVTGNTATSTGAGIGIQGASTLTMIGTTVAGNTVTGRSVEGGGIGVTGENAGIAVANSTVSGNAAIANIGSSAGGGIHAGADPRLVLINVTIASNSASAGGGLAMQGTANQQFNNQMSNTILAGNVGGACLATGLPGVPNHHNLVQDGTCALSGTENVQGIDAPLIELANNGGSTDTRALPAGSLAIDNGGTCAQTDQRGIARPNSACDIGAFEYVAPRLTVTTNVINDSGRTATSVTYRVTRNGADVSGSPASGNGTYTLEPGAFNVSAALSGYTVTIGGDCSATGDVTLGENQTKTCTVVANDNAVLGAQQLPPPVVREKVNAVPARGTIKVKRPGARRFTTLADNGAQLPVGTIVDALKGRVTIVAASDDGGGTDTAVFYGGIFKITQTKGDKPTTVLALTEKLTCPKAGTAIAAAKKKKRRLWGDGEGKFRTKGKHSAATVVGTKWLVEDRCKSTLTRVVRGRVSVRDFAKKKTVIVKRGKRYIARAG